MDNNEDGDEKPKNRWDAVPGAGELHDLDFDFEDYFQRQAAKSLTDEEWKLRDARIYGYFCSVFFKSGGDPSKIPAWVVKDVAEKLLMGLEGAPWNDVMGLPWDVPTQTWSRIGERAFNIYEFVGNNLEKDPKARVTDLIAEASRMHNVAYETARAGYYAIKGGLEPGGEFPENFLRKD